MADVYGRLTGRAAVAMATLGPGATNLSPASPTRTSIARRSWRSPVRRPARQLHKEAHQVVDVVDMFKPVTKWNARIERTSVIPEIVRKAFRVATLEKPGPTHIELPENVAGMVLGPRTMTRGRSSPARPTSPSRRTRPSPTLRSSSTRPSARSSLPGTASSGVVRRRPCARSRRASTCRSRPRSWARARSTTARTCR